MISKFLVDRRGGQCGIIYCLKRDECDSIVHHIKMQGVCSAESYHAKKKANEREDVLKRWTDGSIDVVVATVAFGMGIDKADVRYVVHQVSRATKGHD